MERTVSRVTPTIPELPKKLCVAAYARVSSGKDAMLQSLSAQISYYSELIQRNSGWEYSGVYADEAVTGTKDARNEFQKLLAECSAGRIDLVLTKSISRFARNTVTLLESVRELKKHNVDVYFERENIHSMSGDGELMLSILASYAQEESLSTSENCKWRIRNNFKDGIPSNMRIYGYDCVDRQLVVNAVEAEVVRMIYADYLNGMGKNAIVRKLTAMAIPTKNGCRWSESGILNMLQDEKYTGDMLLQKTFSENHLTKAKHINRGELPMYFVEDVHEAIINKSVFDAVQAELARRAARFASEPKTPALSELTGKIHCDICGANFRRKVNNAGTKYSKPIWSCATFNTRGKAFCSSKQIPENILTEIATEVLRLDEYNGAIFSKKVREIRIPDSSTLIFIFKDGSEVRRTWENTSRRESWTDEMKEQARQSALNREGSDTQCQRQKQ